MHKVLILLCTTFFIPLNTFADVTMQSRDEEGGTGWIYFSGQKMRIDSDPNNYVIIDFKEKKYLVVDQQQHTVLQLNSFFQRLSEKATGAPIERPLTLTPIGEGPKIAGYKTEKYEIRVGNTACGTEFLSKEALANDEVRTMVQKMVAIAQGEWDNEEGGGFDNDPCGAMGQAAEKTLYLAHGFPMKVIDRDGKVSQEVLTLNTKAAVPADKFTVPEDYRTSTFDNVTDSLH